MEPTSAALPLLRVQQLPGYQTGGQQQAPFAQGQLLQGVISGRSATGQFTVDIGGRQLLAESSTPLQVGQRLDLQVASLFPRVELQIVRNPVHQLIGSSIHLIGQQGTSLPELAGLADQALLLAQLSPAARETLQFYAAATTPATPSGGEQAQLARQLLGRTLDLLTQSAGSEARNTLPAEIGALLRELAASPALGPEQAARAATLATLFADPAGQAVSGGTYLSAGIDAALLPSLLAGPQQQPPSGLAASLLSLLRDQGQAGGPLTRLVALLADLEPAAATGAERLAADGGQLQEVLDRLGMNMERLLAEGRPEEAVRTLKFALLELGQQLPAGDRGPLPTDQLVRTIELYQLLQIRLAGESLFFLPLPFSFLDQGYLLVDSDQSRADAQKDGEPAAPRYELHLQLEGLGNLQISILQQQGQLSLRFLAEDAERARFLSDSRGELAERLTGASLASVQFLVGAREPVSALLERIVRGVTGMVDTRA